VRTLNAIAIFVIEPAGSYEPRDLLAEAALEGATGVVGDSGFSSFRATGR
jgi:hypothetical protein